jgi:hypothetical protein
VVFPGTLSERDRAGDEREGYESADCDSLHLSYAKLRSEN